MAYVEVQTVVRRPLGGAWTALVGWPAATAAGLAGLALAEVLARADRIDAAFPAVAWLPASALAVLLALIGTLPLAAVRARPLASAVTVTAATVAALVLYGQATIAAVVAVLIALYLLGRHRSGRAAALLALPFAGYALVTPLVRGDTAGNVVAVLIAALAAGAAALGVSGQVRGEAAAREVSRRAIADTLLEHAARGERARIARELHDVVAHHISMIAVQAETARLTTPGLPGEGAKRLLAIGDTARAALTEMRRLLGVLREDAGTEPSREPQPGLRQLIELTDQARASAGVSTRLLVRGPVVPLDPGVELTAYRIVQEALTNARRHAPGAATDVELAYTPTGLLVRVRDNGAGPVGGVVVAGHGLLGMRERAAALGGSLVAGPGPAGGFLVQARLPIADPADLTGAR